MTIPIAPHAAPVLAPDGWHHSLLDDVAKRGSGHTPSKSHPEYWNGEIRWISLADSDRLDRVFIKSTTAKISEKGLANSSAVLHPAGTVVLSRDAGVGKSAVMQFEMAVSQHFITWQCGPDLNNIFLYYSLQNRKREFERIAAGSTIKTIGLPYFKELTVLCPPRLEQDYIAAALLDADTLIDSLEQLLTKKRQIKQGAMQELLAAKRRLPGFTKAWSCDDLRDLVRTPVTDGPHTTPVFVDSGVPFLSVNNLVGNRIDFTDLRFITKEDDQLFARKCKPQRGDVLLGKAASVGKVAIVDDDLDFNIWSPIALIRPVEELDSRFLYYQLQGRPVTTQISVLTNSSSQGNLGMGDIEKLQIAYPCVDEQYEIASVLSDMDTEITALESRLTKARTLKQAMAQALLTGRIRLI